MSLNPTGTVRIGVLAVAIAALAGCSDSSISESAPADASLVAAGAEVYEVSCAECHGSDLRGTDRGPSHLSIVYESGHHPDEAFSLAVVRGAPQHHWDFGPMPPIAGLDDEAIDAVVAFIRSEQARLGFEPYTR